MDEIPTRFDHNKRIGDRFSDLSMLLRATQPDGYDEYYNSRSPLLGKEISLGIIEKTDMLANDMVTWALLDLAYEGQIDFYWDFMTWYQNDWKASMSIDGKLLDRITGEEIRYTQTQTVHEHQHTQPEVKHGLFSRRKPPGEQ
jgi:hypothetical protein